MDVNNCEEVLTFCEPSVPRNKWRTGRLARCDADVCSFVFLLFFFCGEAPTCTSHQGDNKFVYRSVSCFLLRTDGDAAHCATSLPSKLLKTAGPGLHREYTLLWWDLHNKQKPGTTEALWERARLVKWCSCCEGLRGPCLDELGIAARSRAAALLHSREGFF